MFEDDDQPGFFQRYRILVSIGVLLVLGAGAYALKNLLGHHSSSSRPEAMTMVMLPPPPPKPIPTPPPTPPPEQPPPEDTHPEQKMVEAPTDPKPAPKDKPPDAPAPLGTTISGPGGSSDLALGGGGLGGGNGTGGGVGGSRFGWYYGQVQRSVTDALRNNPHTRKASISGLIVRVSPDSTGRVTRVTLSGSTGDPALDAVIQNEVLNGLQLNEAPPAGLKLPITLRISERRPH